MSVRLFWLTLGLLATACGIAGIVLPLVPTTPFMLLAAFAFARSSQRLHTWLVSHPRLGPPINDWRSHGAISANAKVAALILMVATLVIGFAAGVAKWMLLVQASAFAAAAAFVLSRPTARRPHD
jgi:uncharacterized membrane protein YbaN (DUF454 family)